jgi:hypothetical protein
MRFIAIESVSCASGDNAPNEMPGATRALADLGDTIHLIDWDWLALVAAEIEQVTQSHRRQPADSLGVAAIHLVTVRRDRRLKRMYRFRTQCMCFAIVAPQLIRPANW